MPMTSEEKIKRSLIRLMDSVFELNETLSHMTPKDQDSFIEEAMKEKSKNKILKRIFALEPLITNLRDTVNGEQKKRVPNKEMEESKHDDIPVPKKVEKAKKVKKEESKSDEIPKRTPKKGGTEESKEEKPVKPTKVPKPKEKKSIPAFIRTLVWNQYVGEDMPRTRCLCCRKTWISYQGFHCGHVVAEANGGDMTVSNMRPICAGCNLAMKTENMREFAKRFFGHDLMIL